MFRRSRFSFAIVIAVAVILSLSACFLEREPEPLVWEDIVLKDYLPPVESADCNIILNDSEELYIRLKDKSEENCKEYEKLCIEFGYDLEAEEKYKGYAAYNEDGWELELSYISGLTINLIAPKEMSTITWPSSGVATLLPIPESLYGRIIVNKEDRFCAEIGNTPLSAYGEYVDSVLNSGFTVEYNREEKYFSAKNADGFAVSVEYVGFSTIKIEIKEPDNDISLTKSSSDFDGKLYTYVESELRGMGFTNIQYEVIYDLTTGWLVSDGEIENVTINGNSEFRAGDKFEPESVIVISYHTFKSNKPTEAPDEIEDTFDDNYNGKKYNVKIFIDFEPNVFFDRFDVDLRIDGRVFHSISHGEDSEFEQSLKPGKHTVSFTVSNNNAIRSEEVELVVENDTDVYYWIKTHSDVIDVEQTHIEYFEPATFEYCFECALTNYTLYIFLDEDEKKVVYVSSDMSVQEGTYTGDVENGWTLVWDLYGDHWTEELKLYENGNVVWTDTFGTDWDYSLGDVREGEQVLRDIGYLGYNDGTLKYALSTDGTSYAVIGVVKEQEYIEIPKTYSGLPVVEIMSEAFYENTALVSITIPDTIKTIGSGAFFGCANLESIELPESVKSVGTCAFLDCVKLREVSIPDSIEYVGPGAFETWYELECFEDSGIYYLGNLGNPYVVAIGVKDNEEVTSLKINSNTKVIAGEAFRYCEKLTAIEMPDTLRGIGEGAFCGCYALKSISIPSGVKTIEANTFAACDSLETVKIFGDVISIGEGAFESCLNLRSIDIPDSVVSIGAQAFYYCYSLKSVDMPTGLKIIGKGAFAECESLSNIVIPSEVENIGEYAFQDCVSLESIKLPSTVGNISQGMFQGCIELKSITMANGPLGIEAYAFYECKALEAIEIPGSVTVIGELAFGFCESLESLVINIGVKEIGECAFFSCTKLESVIIPSTVTDIKDQAFSYCESLTEATIGRSVSCIGFGAFMECENLSSVTFVNTTGWVCVSDLDGDDEISVSLSSKAQTAEYLTDTYSGYYWLNKPSSMGNVVEAHSISQYYAKKAVESFGKSVYSYGFEAHWYTGLQNISKVDGAYYFEVTCTVTTLYGTTVDTNVLVGVGGSDSNPVILIWYDGILFT